MAEPNDINRRTIDEEWSRIIGQTNAFLGHVQSLVQREASAAPLQQEEPIAVASTQEDDDTAFVAAFVRSSTHVAIAFHIEGRAISRAKAAYGEPLTFHLRVLSMASLEPEVIFDEPISLPGKAELEIELPKKAAFILVSVGVLDRQQSFHSIAHAAPVAISPSAIYPKEPPPPVFLDLNTASTTTKAGELPALAHDDESKDPNLFSWIG